MAFIFGICNLFYEVFICPLLTIYVIYIKIELEKKKSFFDIAKLISFSSLFFLFPYLVWIITVEFFFGGYSHYGIDSFPGFNVLNLNFFEAIQQISVKAFFWYRKNYFTFSSDIFVNNCLFIKNYSK